MAHASSSANKKAVDIAASHDPSESALKTILTALSAAAREHPDQLFHDVEDLLPQHFPIRSARIVRKVEGRWTCWSVAGDGMDRSDLSEQEVDSASLAGTFSRLPDGALFMTVCAGEIGLLVDEIESGTADALATCAIYLEAALRGMRPASISLRPKIVTAFSHVATRILHSDDLPEILFNITEVAKSELAADICGIMLLEEERLVMQRCVGNASPRTARLSMSTGQGVGGRVLATGRPCFVEDYLANSVISQDFFDLARAEKVRSALAVPLFGDDRIIGVLEVWRRRPSSYSEENVTELDTLAQLASLAIANAKLISAQKDTLQDLERANARIRERADVAEFSADLQRILVGRVLDDFGVEEIVAHAAEALETSVFVFDGSAQLRARSGKQRLSKRDLGLLQRQFTVTLRDETGAVPVALASGGSTILCQRISDVSGRGGWVGVSAPVQESEKYVMALSAISVTVALHDMKAKAAYSAMSEKVSSLVWDLLDAPESIRRLAISRVRDLGVDLGREICLIICSLRGKMPGHQPVAEEALDLRRSLSHNLLSLRWDRSTTTTLVSTRGGEVAALLPWNGRKVADKIALDLQQQITSSTPGFAVDIGISAVCSDPADLNEALRQARLARTVARQSNGGAPVHFGDIGLVGLMMGFKEGMRFDDFGARVLGPLADDKPQSATLRNTLGCFLSQNCHQANTAEVLGIHPKTVAYRIERCQQLTGLDLTSHDDRVLLDLALKALDLKLDAI